MGTLADLLTQNRPDVDTHRALLVLDLQNDFAHTGKLPVTYAPGLANLGPLCDAFRAGHDHIVWLRTEFSHVQHYNGTDTAGADSVIARASSSDAGRAAAADDDADEEDSDDEFIRSTPPSRSTALLKRVAERNKLARQASKPPRDLFLSDPAQNSMQRCCQHGTHGADFVPSVAQLIDPKHDMVMFKSTYSAFGSTNLLFQLRARLVTEIFICGSFTNVAVFATAASAVQHGMQVTILQDCLGYVDRLAHEEALRKMHHSMGAAMSSSEAFVRPPNVKTLRKQRSSVLPRISIKDVKGSPSPSNNAGDESPGSAPSPMSASMRARSKLPKLPQRSPDGTRVTSAARSESRSSHDSPTATSRIPLVRSESRSSMTGGDVPQLQHRTSSFAIRQKPTIIAEGPAEDVVPQMPNTQQLPQTRQGMPAIPRASLRRPAGAVSIGEGDSVIVHDSLDDFLDPSTFAQLKKEVYWQRMFHVAGEVPRLVCAQGQIDPDDGAMPVYRHPADKALPLLQFSPTIERIRRRVEEQIGHPINHCLAQLYRSGQDFISEHSDKTLDIVRGSWIINVSLGAQRTMRLRSKRAARQDGAPHEPAAARQTHKIPLPHGSVFLLGPDDNADFLHGIQANKRPAAEKLDAEQAFAGERISLTFRYIGTFLDAHSRRIWGQGASGKTRARAARVVNGDEAATAGMVKAFGTENQTGREFDWEGVYGGGFDVLHFHSPSSEESSTGNEDNMPIFFRTQGADVGLPVELFLRQQRMPFIRLSAPPSVVFSDAGAVPDMMLRDADAGKTQVVGLEAILLYLDRFYGAGAQSRVPNVASQRLVLGLARMATLSTRRFLAEIEATLRGRGDATEKYLGGEHFSIADCAYWALVEDAVDELAGEGPEIWPHTWRYHGMLTESLGRAADEVEWHDAAEQIG